MRRRGRLGTSLSERRRIAVPLFGVASARFLVQKDVSQRQKRQTLWQLLLRPACNTGELGSSDAFRFLRKSQRVFPRAGVTPAKALCCLCLAVLQVHSVERIHNALLSQRYVNERCMMQALGARPCPELREAISNPLLRIRPSHGQVNRSPSPKSRNGRRLGEVCLPFSAGGLHLAR